MIHWLNGPLPNKIPKPITLGVAEPFLTSVKVSLVVGLALALPVVLWQLWSFLAPAVEEHAQRTVAVFVLFATVLLVATSAGGVPADDRVTTANGIVEGATAPSGVRIFRGIPFAAPPVAARRWMPGWVAT